MLHISDETKEEILSWGGGPEIGNEVWQRFLKKWREDTSLDRILIGKKSDKTSKCKYCGGTAYWMETPKGYRLVDFFNKAHQCENYKLGKVL